MPKTQKTQVSPAEKGSTHIDTVLEGRVAEKETWTWSRHQSITRGASRGGAKDASEVSRERQAEGHLVDKAQNAQVPPSEPLGAVINRSPEGRLPGRMQHVQVTSSEKADIRRLLEGRFMEQNIEKTRVTPSQSVEADINRLLAGRSAERVHRTHVPLSEGTTAGINRSPEGCLVENVHETLGSLGERDFEIDRVPEIPPPVPEFAGFDRNARPRTRPRATRFIARCSCC